MNLILIAGIPGSGKTTISKRISMDLRIPCISKDEIKLELYDRFGFQSSDEKRKLDNLAEQLLYAKIKEHIDLNEDLIVDKWYPDTDMFIEHSNRSKANIICIKLIVSADVASNRHNKRNSEGMRPVALRVLNKYPLVEGISLYEEAKTPADMLIKIQKTPDIKCFNAELKISNNNEGIDSTYQTILVFVEQNLKN